MSFTLFDGIVVIVILISAVLAMVRGFVREVLSVASWAIAAAAAYFFYDDLSPLLEPYTGEDLAIIIAAAAIFFLVLIIATFITVKIADFVIDSRVGTVDRVLGFVFGAARGLLLLVIAYFFFTWLVPVGEQPGWVASAQTRPVLENLGDQLISILPDDVEATLREQFESDGSEAPVTQQPAAQPAASDPFGSRFGPEEPALNYDQGGLNQLLGNQPAAP